MESGQLHYKNSVIQFYKFGGGPKQILCIHGYGEDATTFGFLDSYAGNEATFYAFDLPFHGKTIWKEGLVVYQKELLEITNLLLPQQTNNFTLLGYSLGARIALSIYEKIPNRVEKMVILAPDGLKVNFWYWLATQTWCGNKLFKLTMYHPQWFFGFLKLLHKLKWVNTSIFKFVSHYIKNPEIRKSLYKRWTALRKISPQPTQIKTEIAKRETSVRLVYGNHDRIILSSTGAKFMQGIEANCTLTVITSGHQVLAEQHAAALVKSLLH